MIFFPFIFLVFGILLGLTKFISNNFNKIDSIMNISLIVLMLAIGCNIGLNEQVISNITSIGINCIIIAFTSILFSVIAVTILDKTVLPLSKTHVDYSDKTNFDNSKSNYSFIYIVSICILAGIILGFLFLNAKHAPYIDLLLKISLAILYCSVGMSLVENKYIIQYIKKIGFKIIYLSIAIFISSIISGIVVGFILKLPLYISVTSSSGMSYYSVTGAYLTQTIGVEAGTYGFLVNVFREVLTVILLPLLVRINKVAPIAAGAAGNMDTMLVPVTKFVGKEFGIIALITGTILTLIVPFILPIITSIFL